MLIAISNAVSGNQKSGTTNATTKVLNAHHRSFDIRSFHLFLLSLRHANLKIPQMGDFQPVGDFLLITFWLGLKLRSQEHF